MTDDDLGDLVHPADRVKTTTVDTAGDYVCRWCPDSFDNFKALSLHETGSHRTEVCSICGMRVGLRGLANHESFCRAESSGTFDEIMPDAALSARHRDFLERANEPVDRDDVYCLTCDDDEPEFVSLAALPTRVEGRGKCWMFQACRIAPELFFAPPRRDRRTGVQPTDPNTPKRDQAPLPKLTM